ncbi:MAG: hypothetical protein ACTHOC_00125 [Luteimonas sp.]
MNGADMDTPLASDFRTALSAAIAYWEPRRLLYNGWLLAVVVATWCLDSPRAPQSPPFELAQQLFLLAVLANVAFCAAYPVDVLAQLSDFRARWLRVRWGLLTVGLLFAAVPAHFISRGLFGG